MFLCVQRKKYRENWDRWEVRKRMHQKQRDNRPKRKERNILSYGGEWKWGKRMWAAANGNLPHPHVQQLSRVPQGPQVWLMWLWHTCPRKGQFIPSALLSPQAREHSQPAHTKHIQLIDVLSPALATPTPNARELYFVLPCLETEMLSYRTSLMVQLGQEKTNTLMLVGHISLGIEKKRHTVLASPYGTV